MFDEYCRKMFKARYLNFKTFKLWLRQSGGSQYEGTDYNIYATFGIDSRYFNLYKKDELTEHDCYVFMSEYEKKLKKIIKKFYDKHPDPYDNFVTKYKTNDEVTTSDSWNDVENDRSKYFVGLSVPDTPHPYSFGTDLFGFVCDVTEGDTRTSASVSGGVMPAVYIKYGRSYTYTISILKNEFNWKENEQYYEDITYFNHSDIDNYHGEINFINWGIRHKENRNPYTDNKHKIAAISIDEEPVYFSTFQQDIDAIIPGRYTIIICSKKNKVKLRKKLREIWKKQNKEFTLLPVDDELYKLIYRTQTAILIIDGKK